MALSIIQNGWSSPNIFGWLKTFYNEGFTFTTASCTSSTGFYSLPGELIHHITANLHAKDFVKMSRVCSDFYKYSKENAVVQCVVLNTLPKIKLIKDSQICYYEQFRLLFNQISVNYRDLLIQEKDEYKALKQLFTSDFTHNGNYEYVADMTDQLWRQYKELAESAGEPYVDCDLDRLQNGDFVLPESPEVLEQFQFFINFADRVRALVGTHYDGDFLSIDPQSDIGKAVLSRLSRTNQKKFAKLICDLNNPKKPLPLISNETFTALLAQINDQDSFAQLVRRVEYRNSKEKK